MELIHRFLDIVAPPITFFSLFFLVPPYQCFKYFLYLLSSVFSENVAGKVVIITGASSGIGEHIAYEYAKRGACLALGDRREKSLREVADNCLELGSPDVIVINADVSKVEDCGRLVDESINRFGRLDHLVNNAGVSSVAMLEEIPNISDFREVMTKGTREPPNTPVEESTEFRGKDLDINFWGSVYTTRFAAPHLKNTRGKIVGLASSAAWLPVPRMSIYNASNAALVSLYETLKVEFGPEISITIVTPGFIESEMTLGKFLLGEGRMEVDQKLRDTQVGATPVLSVRSCAEAIVKSALRGDRYLTEPSWFNATYYWKVFCPELLETLYRILYVPGPGESHIQAISKKILDFTGVQSILYPETIQTPQIQME